MHWMNPQGAWALSALGAILILYILKQRLQPKTVSSTYLWQKALAEMEADRPFQRLRRSLLMLVQLLFALLLALSLMRPMTLGDQTGEMLMVFDLSASMQADGGGGSRLQAAIRDAQRRIDGAPEGTRVSVLTAGADAAQPLARTSDHLLARRVVGSLTAENGSADLDGAMSLALALRRELEETELIVYTDQNVNEPNIVQPYIGDGLENRALLSLNASGAAAVARLANYGKAASVTVECYADGKLCDARPVALLPGATLSVSFDLPDAYAEVEARIVEADALPPDNIRHFAVRERAETTVVLAGRNNIFIEKALSLRPDITLLKTTVEEASLVSGGALTVIDGPLPEALPERGALLLIDPDAFVLDEKGTVSGLSAANGALADEINQYLQLDAVQLARYHPVAEGTPIWYADGDVVLSLLEKDGRRVALLGFDLHESNLPLLKEFPLFIQHLLEVLVPEPLGAGTGDASCGEKLPIAPQTFAREASVVTPSGTRIPIPLTGGTLTDTNEIGVYSLVQVDEAGVSRNLPFALHIPAGESDLREVFTAAPETPASGLGSAYGREWTPLVILLAALLILLEWWVYKRGH